MYPEHCREIVPKINRILRRESPITTLEISKKLGINRRMARIVLLEIEKRGRITRTPSFNGKNWWIKIKK